MLGSGIAAAAVDDDVGTGGGEGFGDRAADALGGAGDEGGVAVEGDHGEGSGFRVQGDKETGDKETGRRGDKDRMRG